MSVLPTTRRSDGVEGVFWKPSRLGRSRADPSRIGNQWSPVGSARVRGDDSDRLVPC